MKTAPTQGQSEKITQLGAECVNYAINRQKVLGEKFQWRNLKSMSLFVEQVEALDASDAIKQRIFAAFLPKFDDEIEPITQDI